MPTIIRFFSLLLLLTLAAYGNTHADPGVTDTSVKVGMIADLTGPIAYVGQELSAGARLYLQHVNAQGGVHGRRIDLVVEDDGYRPPRTVAAFRKLVDRDRVFCFVGNIGTPTTVATFPFIARERIPVVAPGTFSSTMSTPPKRYIFALDPSYDIQSWIAVKYILEVEKAEKPKLAVVYQDDDVGTDGLKGLKAAVAHYGLTLVAEESYKRGAVDFSTQAMNLQKANPTHVLLLTVAREAAAIMKKAHQSNWRPQFIGWLPNSDDKVIELAGEAAEGFVALQSFDIWSKTGPTQRYHSLIQKYDPEHRPGFYHAGGYSAASMLVEGLKRAGRDLTREKLVEALETFKTWQDYLGPPVTYGPNLRGGKYAAAFIVRADMEKKTLVPTTDWIYLEMPEKIAQIERK